jgi:tRNA dimethylallyltransferase
MQSSAGSLLPAAQGDRPQVRTPSAQRPLNAAASPAGVAVLGIFGPTASGKTAVAEAIAAQIPAEIVSADSMQVYRGLPILTNQGSGRLVGVWPLDRQGTVGEYQRLAHEAIDGVVASGRTAIVVGGSGLWFQAALKDVRLPPDVTGSARARWERLYDRRGAATAHAVLERRDRRAAAQVHPNDRKRVVRALELWQAGETLVPERSRLWSAEPRLPTLVIGLELAPEVLAERIHARTARMFAHGVEAEALTAGKVAPQVLGLEALRTLPAHEAAAEIERATIRLAAYQRKWLRRLPGIVRIDADRSPEEVAHAILEVARAR